MAFLNGLMNVLITEDLYDREYVQSRCNGFEELKAKVLEYPPERAAEIYSAKTGQNLTIVQYSIKTWDGAWISDPHEMIPSVTEYARVDYELGYTGEKLLTEEDLFETSFYDRVTS